MNVWKNTVLCLLVVIFFMMPISTIENHSFLLKNKNEEIFSVNQNGDFNNKNNDYYSYEIDGLSNNIYNRASPLMIEKYIELVVSDGLTNNDITDTDNEIPPGVTLYRFQQNQSFLKYFFAEHIKDIEIQFFIRYKDDDWILLNDEPLLTNADGNAYLSSLKPLIPKKLLDLAPVDLQLKAVAQLDDGSEVFDDKGMIRVLDKSVENNPFILAVDHDNTLHATGGLNAMVDIIRFLNWAADEWPVVDGYVQDAISSLRNNNTDIIIVTGLPNPLRAACREQVNIHFENNDKRFIPMIIKSDLSYEHSNEFKAATLGIIISLYGKNNFIAMVGDTVRQDGYGAYSNQLRYIPFQIHYKANPDLLDTEGYGFIDPKIIATDWSDVMTYISEGDTVTNFFLQNEYGFLNIAHRGGGDLRPENTILCYRYAIQVGADVLEGDLHATKDGIVVVSHDETVDRCTNGTGEITSYVFDDLRKLDAGYWYSPDNGETYPYRGYAFNGVNHLQIPTLEEVFSDNQLNKTPMILEIKQQDPSIVDDVLDLIERYNMEEYVVIGSFDKESLDEIREKSNIRGMPIITSFCEDEVLDFYLTFLPSILSGSYIPSGSILQVPIEYNLNGITVPVVTSFFMNKARFLGLNVQVWTINDPDEMRWLMHEVKVDGIMTDNPELLEQILNE